MALISRKKAILKALSEYLETEITPANGYINDLTDKAYRGRTQFGNEAVVPFLAVLEAPRPIDPDAAGSARVKRKSKWPILVQGFAADDRRHPADPAYDLAADVERAMAKLIEHDDQGRPKYPQFYGLPPFNVGIEVQETIVRPPQADISDTAFFYLPVIIDVVTDLSDPYIVI